MDEKTRDALKNQLDALGRASSAISGLMEPHKKALAEIQGVRDGILEEHGIEDEPDYCEGCSAILITGDLVHRCADGPILCETCAPTVADCHAQLLDRLAEETDDEEANDLREAIDSCAARMNAGDGDKKSVDPL
jgi:hypothetical protein